MFPHKDTLLPKISKKIGKYYQVLMIMTQKEKILDQEEEQ